MKVSVDREQCINCGVCWSECPELFEESGEDGKCAVVAAYRDSGDVAKGEAPESLRTGAQAAADGCPVEIIRVE
jgi:ferredoxin